MLLVIEKGPVPGIYVSPDRQKWPTKVKQLTPCVLLTQRFSNSNALEIWTQFLCARGVLAEWSADKMSV